jgi:hypothetical protein
MRYPTYTHLPRVIKITKGAENLILPSIIQTKGKFHLHSPAGRYTDGAIRSDVFNLTNTSGLLQQCCIFGNLNSIVIRLKTGRPRNYWIRRNAQRTFLFSERKIGCPPSIYSVNKGGVKLTTSLRLVLRVSFQYAHQNVQQFPHVAI